MDAKKHYEDYWGSKKKKEEFLAYPRNLVLSDFFSKKEKVLDLGCGDGAVSEYLKKELGMDVVGADISKKALSIAKKRGIKTVLVDAEKKLPFKDNAFDTVFWGDNAEHLFDPAGTLNEIYRILKIGGRVVVSVPNMGYFRYRVYYLMHGALPDTEWTGHKPWAWSHIRFFNKNILTKFLESSGFAIERVVGVNSRKVDKIFANYFPGMFGMIFVVSAKVQK